MATQTAPKKKRTRAATKTARKPQRTASKTNGRAPAKAKTVKKPSVNQTADSEWASLTSIEARLLVENDYNARQVFDKTKLAELASSIKNAGLQQNLVVRQKVDGFYEIICGARRFRAAKLAGLDRLPCRVTDVTDEEAREISAIENLERENLNPIEVARALQAMLEPDGNYTVTALSRRLKRSQGWVSNHVGLLKLPEAWQARIVSGEINGTKARHMIPMAEYPNVLGKIDEEAEAFGEALGDLSVEGFRDVLYQAVLDGSRELDPKMYRGPKFKITPELKADLDIKNLEDDHRQTRRAMNVELWDRLQAEAEQRGNSKAKKKAKADVDRDEQAAGRSKKKTTADNLDPKQLEADRKAAREEEKRKAKEAAARLEVRYIRFKIDLVQTAISKKLANCPTEVLLMLLLRYSLVGQTAFSRGSELSAAIKKAGGKGGSQLSALNGLTAGKVVEAARAALAAWIFERLGCANSLSASELQLIADRLEVDVAKEFTLNEEFLEMHTTAQLYKLAGEMKLKPVDSLKKAELIKVLLADNLSTFCPKKLLSVKLRYVG